MGFVVVSISKHPLEEKHKIDKKLLEVGIITYVDDSGKDATFSYESRVNYNNVVIVVPIVRDSLDVVGRKYCYCKDRFDPNKPEQLIKYVPDSKFDYHPYNCFKYKPDSIVRAEVTEGKAYVIDK